MSSKSIMSQIIKKYKYSSFKPSEKSNLDVTSSPGKDLFFTELRTTRVFIHQILDDTDPLTMDETILRDAQRIEHQWRSYLGLWIESVKASPSKENKDDMRHQVIDLWKRAPNWDTLVELNRLYLMRKLPVCASYGQPPDAETDVFPNILLLHSYGVITTNSCPGWERQLEFSSLFARQRAFLFFSIPTHNLQTTSSDSIYNFIQRMKGSSEVRVYIRFQYDNALNGVQRDPNISGLMQYGSCDNLPDSDDPVWEQEGWDVDPDDEGVVRFFDFTQEQRRKGTEGDWTDHGKYGFSTFGSSFQDDNAPFQASRAADPLQIAASVVARDWNYTGIGDLVKYCLDQSGIIPRYGL